MLNRRTSLSALMTLALGVWATGTALTQQDPELATTVDEGFTIAMVGDLIYAHDLGHMMRDESFAAVVELLRAADVATGNLEGIIVDGRTFTGSRMGGHGAEPGAADSLKDMGFDMAGVSLTSQADRTPGAWQAPWHRMARPRTFACPVQRRRPGEVLRDDQQIHGDRADGP